MQYAPLRRVNTPVLSNWWLPVLYTPKTRKHLSTPICIHNRITVVRLLLHLYTLSWWQLGTYNTTTWAITPIWLHVVRLCLNTSLNPRRLILESRSRDSECSPVCVCVHTRTDETRVIQSITRVRVLLKQDTPPFGAKPKGFSQCYALNNMLPIGNIHVIL